jgi:hypothetical protein
MDKKAIIEKMKEMVRDGYSYQYAYTDGKGITITSTSVEHCPQEMPWEKEFSNLESATLERQGGQGQGDEYHVVQKFTDKTTKESFLVMFTASYDSFNGTDWSYSEVFECELVEKTITVYEAAK